MYIIHSRLLLKDVYEAHWASPGIRGYGTLEKRSALLFIPSTSSSKIILVATIRSGRNYNKLLILRIQPLTPTSEEKREREKNDRVTYFFSARRQTIGLYRRTHCVWLKHANNKTKKNTKKHSGSSLDVFVQLLEAGCYVIYPVPDLALGQTWAVTPVQRGVGCLH